MSAVRRKQAARKKKPPGGAGSAAPNRSEQLLSHMVRAVTPDCMWCGPRLEARCDVGDKSYCAWPARKSDTGATIIHGSTDFFVGPAPNGELEVDAIRQSHHVHVFDGGPDAVELQFKFVPDGARTPHHCRTSLTRKTDGAFELRGLMFHKDGAVSAFCTECTPKDAALPKVDHDLPQDLVEMVLDFMVPSADDETDLLRHLVALPDASDPATLRRTQRARTGQQI
eukprot:m.311419 g.311419  ORF g.311419 m.311419 type:complete len:226 (-) comp27527_c0_seq1:27-704(-)